MLSFYITLYVYNFFKKKIEYKALCTASFDGGFEEEKKNILKGCVMQDKIILVFRVVFQEKKNMLSSNALD